VVAVAGQVASLAMGALPEMAAAAFQAVQAGRMQAADRLAEHRKAIGL